MTNLNPDLRADTARVISATTFSSRQQLIKVFGYIILFFLLYVALVFTAIALAIGCMAGGIALMRYYGYFLSVIPGVALIVLGCNILFFLGRFLFHRSQPVNPYRLQLDLAAHPKLTKFLQQLVEETQIRFPRKVFLVPDVSISLFYHSSFFNLFWPLRKNLEIGLGLVNSVNISEFRMLLAHEFGHFSGGSMRLGSYVYGLNKLLHNMLYENDGWNDMSRHRNSGSISGFFVHITCWVISAIQVLLRRSYQLINREYQQVSRDLELQADDIAVHAAGTTAALSAIRRADIGTYCMDHCLHKLPELYDHKQRFQNIFKVQRQLIRYYTLQSYATLDKEGLPVVSGPCNKVHLKSRVQLRHDWALQPNAESRVDRYLEADVEKEVITDSAWRLFSDAEQLQEQVTNRVYEVLTLESSDFDWMCPQRYVTELEQRHRIYEFPKAFNDYYDNRAFTHTDIRLLQPLSPEEMNRISFGGLYHPDVVLRMRTYYRDYQDSETLHAIALQQLQTPHFEFDGKRYRACKAQRIGSKLAAHVEQEQQWLAANDILACRYHYTQALRLGADRAGEMILQYQQILDYQRDAVRLSDLVIRVIHSISLIFSTNSYTVDAALPFFEALSADAVEFRKLLLHVITCPTVASNLPQDIKASIEHFRLHKGEFIQDGVPDYAAIKELHDISSSLMEHLNNCIILLKKNYLELILEIDARYTVSD
ncbi:Zn-dependent protease with chaperone function [Chitinophaga jiangningensis]|uniref:Zn-dependent protease with chaperone function n=1 Tax=Chitinophaga jiangningensis TaxID=1419482 RepID=A0A1M6WD99_9BACT|nr:M48 family metalloprotease [Chitinophaga jiangningensis]SHK91624.1 Zn-dependent protease with chaperone function [Chitinophaga jiangningensis]